MKDVRFINVAAYDELKVSSMYDFATGLPKMGSLFPSKYPKGRQCSRSYFYNCWNTCYPDDIKELLNHANSQRFSMKNEKLKQDSILLTEEWKQQLDSLPFCSKQKGRMSHLLKQKSKVGIIHKDRVKYEPYSFDKRPRDRI